MAYKLTKTKQSPETPIHKLKRRQTKKSSTQNGSAQNELTEKLKDSPTQKLNSLSFILQHHSKFRSILAKI